MEICKTQPKMFIHFLTNIYIYLSILDRGEGVGAVEGGGRGVGVEGYG